MKILNKIIGKGLKVILLIAMLTTSIMPANAKIVFDNEFIIDNVDGNNWIVDVGDDTTGDIGIQFGTSIAETLTWNSISSWFEFSNVVSLNENQIVDMEIENVSALPGGGSGLGADGEGRLVILDTTDSTAPGCTVTSCVAGVYVWDGSTWDSLTAGGSSSDPTKVVTVAASGADYTTISAAATDLNSRGGGIMLLSAATHTVTTAVDLSNITLIGKGQEKTTITVSGSGQLDSNGTNFKWLTLSSATGLTDDMIIDMASGSSSVIFEYVNLEVTDAGDVVIDSNAGTAPTVAIKFINSNLTAGSGEVLKTVSSANLNSSTYIYVESRTSDYALLLNDWDVTLVGMGSVNTSGTITSSPGGVIFVSPDMDLQGAIDSLETAGIGGSIQLLPGTHSINATVTIEDDDIHIHGYGDSTVISASGLTGGETVAAIQVGSADESTPVNGIHLHSFKLEVSGTGASDIHGIRVTGGEDNRIEDVTIQKVSGASGTGSGTRVGIIMTDGEAGGGTGPDGWTKYFEFTTQASQIPADATDFPVYFDMSELGDSHDFWADYDATTDNDLVITNSDGTIRYPVEVVFIDEGTTPNSGELYFKVPVLDGDANTTYRLYYDNPSISAQPAANSTYGSQNVWTSYEGVWHLNSTSSIDSSAIKQLNETSGGTINNDSNGQLGGAIDFDGSTGYIEIDRPIEDDFTISFWANADGDSITGTQWWEGAGFVDSDLTGSYNDFGVAYLNNGPAFGNGPNPDTTLDAGNTINDNSWHYVVATRDQSSGVKYLYVDDNSPTTETANTNTWDDPTYMRFGSAQIASYFFDGSMDEIRISSDIKDANWITTEYNNTSAPDTFFSIGSTVYDVTPGDKHPLIRPTIFNSKVLGDSEEGAYFTDGIHITSDGSYNSGVWGSGEDIENAIVKGNQINYVGEAGITLTGIIESSIENNIISNFGVSTAGKGIRLGNAENLIASANIINGSQNASSIGIVIEKINTGGLKTTTNSVFNDNVIDGTANNGLGLIEGIGIGNDSNTEVSRCNFTGNVIKGAAVGTTTAILIAGNADDNLIADNDLTGGTNAWDTGISIGSSSQDANIVRDNIYSNVTARIVENGTATKIQTNHHRSGSDPTVNDDLGDGYEVGTIWVNTTSDDTYLLTDSTVGAANWEQINEVSTGFGSGTTSNTFTIDSDNTGGDLAYQFGDALGEYIGWDSANSEFDLSDSLVITQDGQGIEIGAGGAADVYMNFDDGTARNFGWDDNYSGTHTGGTFSTFNQEFAFTTLQSSEPPATCSSAIAGMQWMDTDTGIMYSCDTSNGRNKWLSINQFQIWGEENGSCAAGQDAGSSEACNVDWGDGLGPNGATDLGLYIPYPITITGYGFSEDNDACTSGSFDVEIWSTGSNADDNNYTLTQTVGAGLTGQAHNSNALNLNVAGNEYILWGIDNNCGQAIDDFNVILYYRYRHD